MDFQGKERTQWEERGVMEYIINPLVSWWKKNILSIGPSVLVYNGRLKEMHQRKHFTLGICCCGSLGL